MRSGIIKHHVDWFLCWDLLLSTHRAQSPEKPLHSLICCTTLKRVEEAVGQEFPHDTNNSLAVPLWRNY